MLAQSGMAELDGDRVEKRVVVENVSSTSTRNSAVGWVIIGIVAVALLIFILTKIT